ncbi:MAG: hypothetical protein JEZ06_16615 [Anaerolineaceae bacterium]|nr:hypothetical protein [Anaerolineaceae bacterium]
MMLYSVYDGRKNFKVVDEFGSLTLGTFLIIISKAGLLYLSYRDMSRFIFLFFTAQGFSLIFLWGVFTGWKNMISDSANALQCRRVLPAGGR